MENEFIFILGQARELAAYELKQILKNRLDFGSFIVEKNRATIKSKAKAAEIAGLINILGGTIKIGRLVGEGEWLDAIHSDIKARPTRDVGISDYSDNSQKLNDIWSLKNDLREEGIKIRLVIPRGGQTLNEAEIRSNKLIDNGREYLVAGGKVYETLAVQKVGEFVERDYGKPRNNAFSGMLPPKLARMMVNITTSAAQYQKSNIKNQKYRRSGQLEIRSIRSISPSLTVIDPFCGSGNILLEAMDLGYSVVGSDISRKAVEWSSENLAWFSNQISDLRSQNEKTDQLDSGLTDWSVATADATKNNFFFGQQKTENRLRVVVTEPYLGQPKKSKVSRKQAEKELDELAQLYLSFLINLKRLTTDYRLPITVICLVFPAYETYEGGLVGLYSQIVDKIADLGYTRLAGPFTYGRGYQVVKREVLLLTVKG